LQLSPQTTSQRLYFLDWLRVIAFTMLVLYHVGRYYVTWGWHVMSPYAGPTLQPWMNLSDPWRMSLLFLVSGAATSYMVKGGVSWPKVRKRSAYLLLPLLCGILLLVPPQSYFEAVQKYGYQGTFLEFLPMYYLGQYKDFCREGRCLIVPAWNHLWFLLYLWFYTMVLFGALQFARKIVVGLGLFADRALRGFLFLLVPTVMIVAARWWLFERFPSTYAVVGDWYNHLVYLGMFVGGYVFATTPGMWDRCVRLRWAALVLAGSFWATLVTVHPLGLIGQVVMAVLQWSAIVAAIGFAKTHLNFDHPLRAKLTAAVFPVYIFHQTVIIVSSQLLAPLNWPPSLEGPILIVLTFSLSGLGYLLVRRFSLLHPWFGIPRSQT
jgi:glucans biosynthesis protein C